MGTASSAQESARDSARGSARSSARNSAQPSAQEDAHGSSEASIPATGTAAAIVGPKSESIISDDSSDDDSMADPSLPGLTTPREERARLGQVETHRDELAHSAG